MALLNKVVQRNYRRT